MIRKHEKLPMVQKYEVNLGIYRHPQYLEPTHKEGSDVNEIMVEALRRILEPLRPV